MASVDQNDQKGQEVEPHTLMEKRKVLPARGL